MRFVHAKIQHSSRDMQYAMRDVRYAIWDAQQLQTKLIKASGHWMRDMWGITQIELPAQSPKIKGKNGNWNIIKTAGRQGSRGRGSGESIDSPCDCIYSICPNTNEQPHRRESEARQLLSLCAYLLCNLALPNFRLLLYWYWLMAVWAALYVFVLIRSRSWWCGDNIWLLNIELI